MITEGVALSLVTALMWAIGPICFASIARRIGSLRVLVLARLSAVVVLCALLGAYLLVVPSARVWPTQFQWIWIIVSSLLGMVLGDGLLYEAYVFIGPRRATQILMIAPVASASVAWFIGERLTPVQVAGMIVVLGAVGAAVTTGGPATGRDREPGKMNLRGSILAAVSAIAIGVGAVAGRYAYLRGNLDPAVATVIRVAISAVAFYLMAVARGRHRGLLPLLRDPWLVKRLMMGVIAAPVVGMLCYMGALKLINPGLVSTFSQTSPLFMLPMVWYRYDAHIGSRIVLATSVAVFGIALICWW